MPPTRSFLPAYTPSSQLSPDLQAAEQRFHQQLASNPELALSEYERRFGNIIDRDNARELFSEYGTSRESRQALGPATFRPAGLLVDELYRRSVAAPDPSGGNFVVFNAGGPGVGKSTGIANEAQNAQFVVDGTLSNYAKSRANIQTALRYGKKVGLNYTQCPFEQALQNINQASSGPEQRSGGFGADGGTRAHSSPRECTAPGR